MAQNAILSITKLIGYIPSVSPFDKILTTWSPCGLKGFRAGSLKIDELVKTHPNR
jgi:hypothetical protein